jgi:hypothetical protein
MGRGLVGLLSFPDSQSAAKVASKENPQKNTDLHTFCTLGFNLPQCGNAGGYAFAELFARAFFRRFIGVCALTNGSDAREWETLP